MKRSEINRLIEEALIFFEQHKLFLPKWAGWTADKWKKVGEEANEIKKHGMGWNITDFGSGKFDETGLLLFILRNGCLEKSRPLTTKIYAEKAMMVKPGQITPWHFHWMKTEGLINRGGGRLEVELAWSSDCESELDERDVYVQVDGITRKVRGGGTLILEPGESVTLPPKLCHQFRGHTHDQAVCVGEVGSLNDDSTDNCFVNGIGERRIEEDEAAKYYLCSEYPN